MSLSLSFFMFSFIFSLSSFIPFTFSSLYFNILLYVWLILVKCSWHSEYHTKLKMARNHHVVDLKLKTSYSALLKKYSLDCEQHKDCEVEYFCVDHDELCCCDCLSKTHKSCVNTMSLDSASKGAKHHYGRGRKP
jgi:hypothetical protein